MTITTTRSAPIFVHSPDGTRIGVFVSGLGRPLVLVPGTSADHTSFRMVPHCSNHNVRLHAEDRRGRGVSGDGPSYALDRENEDLAAVVDAASAHTVPREIRAFGEQALDPAQAARIGVPVPCSSAPSLRRASRAGRTTWPPHCPTRASGCWRGRATSPPLLPPG